MILSGFMIYYEYLAGDFACLVNLKLLLMAVYGVNSDRMNGQREIL